MHTPAHTCTNAHMHTQAQHTNLEALCCGTTLVRAREGGGRNRDREGEPETYRKTDRQGHLEARHAAGRLGVDASYGQHLVLLVGAIHLVPHTIRV